MGLKFIESIGSQNIERLVQFRVKPDVDLLEAIEEAIEHADLLANMVVEDCDYCAETGLEPETAEDACHCCGGYGETVELGNGPTPCEVEAAQKTMKILRK